MLGVLAALTESHGTIHSKTAKSCTYTFPREQFYGDYAQLLADFANGATLAVNFRRHPETMTASIVRRVG
jgi:hypothetical protein